MAVLLALGVALVASGCSSKSDDSGVVTVTQTIGNAGTAPLITAPNLGESTSSTAAVSSSTIVTANGVRITTLPRSGAKDVPPNSPVSVSVFSAKISTMTLKGDDGTTINGSLSADKQTWTTTERLNYNTTYTMDGVATATIGGIQVPIKSTLTTVKPAKTMPIQINIPDGGVVGVGAPIIVTFLGQVSDRAAAEKALTVTTSAGAQVEGNWGWLQDEDFEGLGYKQSQVHWRPTKSPATGSEPYWPAGTKVTVTANMRGVNYGGGVWGKDDVTSGFSVRPNAIVVKADASSFHLVVLSDDKVIKNYAVSYGKESIPGRGTLNGVHIVMGKYPEVSMCNPQFDYCNAEEKWAVRINNNGEFIHENLKAAAAFGIANVSHGCINMGEPAAKEFYDMAMFGDPVEVSNTGGPQMTEQNYIYDWIYSPTDWKALSALA